jgi:branched-chain amino acid transport system substrate-binding protein
MHTQQWRDWAVGATMLVTVIMLAGCAKQTSQPPAAQQQTVKIGVLLSLTGDVAAYGERSRKGIMLAIDEVNSKGGINGKPLQVILEDAKSSPKDAVAAVQKLIMVDRVSIVVGDVLSSTTLAVAPIAERNKVVLFAPGASNPKLRDAGDYVFRNWASDDYDGSAIAAYAYKRANVKSIAILAQQTDYCLGLAQAFEREFEKLGGKVLIKEYFKTEAVDLRSQLTKIRRAGASAVYVSAEARQTGTALRQAAELRFSPSWFTNLTVDTPECALIAGQNREGVIFSTPAFDLGSERPEVQQFVQAFRAKYKVEPEVTAGHAYDAIKILVSVMQKWGTDAESVKKGLYAVRNFPGVTGLTTFDDHGDVVKGVFIKKISHGKPILLEEFKFE